MNVNGYESKAAALLALKNAGFPMASALSKPDMNPKVQKNQKLGVLASPLHLAPARLSGFEVCPQRSAGCTAACLHTAGNPAYMAGKHKSRIAKTKAYMTQRKAFVAVIAFEIAALERKAKNQAMQAGVRLNATSDIPWERVALVIDGKKVSSLMQAFPGVEFYDYTKVTKRALAWSRGDMPENYHLTFSKSESNDSAVSKVLKAGGNVAAVFEKLPETWQGVPVINGDEHDFRPADPRGCVVGLKAKGEARHDESGFVIRSKVYA